jgi:hypothetical protein
MRTVAHSATPNSGIVTKDEKKATGLPLAMTFFLRRRGFSQCEFWVKEPVLSEPQ